MSYNISKFIIISQKDFKIPQSLLAENKDWEDWYGNQIGESQHFILEGAEDTSISGIDSLCGRYIEEVEIVCYGEGSRWDYTERLIPILTESKGQLSVLEVWEGGDTMRVMEITDGNIIYKDLVEMLTPKKNIWIEYVNIFNKTYNLPCYSLEEAPQEHIGLLLSLIEEEHDELEEALTHKDPVETLDALADLLYVTIGCGVRLELDLEEGFRSIVLCLEDSSEIDWVERVRKDMCQVRSKIHHSSFDMLQSLLSKIDREINTLKGGLLTRKANLIQEDLAAIIYYTIRCALTLELPIQEAFAEVQASNMSKLGEDGKPIYRNDGKLLKGPNYFKPDFSKLLENYND
jgi:predicted HAD superfamily Cof-like phosphohydrolase